MTIARVYFAPFVAQSVTNDSDQDVWLITSASTKKVILHGFSLTSSYTTDERAALKLIRRSTAGSGGGTAITIEPTDSDNSIAATSTVTPLVTTPGTAGDVLAAWQWSQQGELLFLPTPEIRPVMPVSSYLALHLTTALGGTRTWSGWIAFEEL